MTQTINGISYNQVDIPGFGMCFVPVKENELTKLKKLNIGELLIKRFNVMHFTTRPIYDIDKNSFGLLISEGPCEGEVLSGFPWCDSINSLVDTLVRTQATLVK